MLKMLNLGCGNRYHNEWINLDFISKNDKVIAYDLHNPLPYENESMDVVYSSHVLEHFSKSHVPEFLSECFRILKKGGILRIAVPDLEQLARNYIHFLEDAKTGDIQAQQKYEWTLIELFDQMVRNFAGGEMAEYWKMNPMPQEEFVIARLGSEVKEFRKAFLKSDTSQTKDTCLNISAEEIGMFRRSGEVHQWMYDEYSLGKLLIESGFEKVKRMDAHSSEIINFKEYLLDCEQNGEVRKPDSLFMEGVK